MSGSFFYRPFPAVHPLAAAQVASEYIADLKANEGEGSAKTDFFL